MRDELRADICRWARRTVADGLVVGRSGNLSVRSGDLVAVTPTGVDSDGMRAEDVPVLTMDGVQVAGALLPTSELPMHLAAYAADPACRAVVHTHAVHATAVGLLVDEVPAVHYVLALLGDTVRVAPYAPYGTDALAAGMVEALRGRYGCLLRNHGTVTTGTDLAQAYERTVQLEWACRLWLLARPVGEPAVLSGDEMRRIALRLKTYGQLTAGAVPQPADRDRTSVGRATAPGHVPQGDPP